MKVAAYCRVSTDREDQANSFESQVRYFREYIERTPGWELYQIYADEGISGTSTKKRVAFNKMITDAKMGKFELILTKEISRFARNTLDSIYYTRQLRRQGVGVFFVNDNINTRDPDAELRLTILSSIAQEESRRTSERVKWGQKRRMEQGVVFGRSMLGYDVHQGNITINEEGAMVVRQIYHKFLNEGKGTYVIARELKEEGVSPTYAKMWSSSVILRILRNEKYCGDLIQKKTFTPDYLTHEKRYNKGEEDFVILRDHHEPIIDREQFDKVQTLLDCRARQKNNHVKYSNRYLLSGKIFCGNCGKPYIARVRKRANGSEYLVWRCDHIGTIDRDGEGRNECIHQSIKNEELETILLCMNRELPINREYLLQHLTELILRSRDLLQKENKPLLEHTMKDICHVQTQQTKEMRTQCQTRQEERKRLLQAYLKGYISEEEFFVARKEYDEQSDGWIGKEVLEDNIEDMEKEADQIEKEVDKIGKEADKIEKETDQIELEKKVVSKIEDLLNSRQFDEELYRPLVSRIIRMNDTMFQVILNHTTWIWTGEVKKK